MAMSESTLSDELKAMDLYDNEPDAASAWADAFDAYFQDAEVTVLGPIASAALGACKGPCRRRFLECRHRELAQLLSRRASSLIGEPLFRQLLGQRVRLSPHLPGCLESRQRWSRCSWQTQFQRLQRTRPQKRLRQRCMR